MAVEYETIQQRRLPVDGYYSESNNSEKESLIPSYGAKTVYKDATVEKADHGLHY